MSYQNNPTMQPTWNEASKRAKEPFLFPIAHDELLRKQIQKPVNAALSKNTPAASALDGRISTQAEQSFHNPAIRQPSHVDVERLIREINGVPFADVADMPKQYPAPQQSASDQADIYPPSGDWLEVFEDRQQAASEWADEALDATNDEGDDEDAVPTHLMATPVSVPTQLYTIPTKKKIKGWLIAGLVIVVLLGTAATLWSAGLLNQWMDLVDDFISSWQ